MSDHADHHAAPEKPNATTFMGFAIFLGMATVLIALVGGIRDSKDVLTIGLVTGALSIALAVVAAIAAKGRGRATRGFLVSVVLGATGVAMYALVTSV